jgi:hypothetical protein
MLSMDKILPQMWKRFSYLNFLSTLSAPLGLKHLKIILENTYEILMNSIQIQLMQQVWSSTSG